MMFNLGRMLHDVLNKFIAGGSLGFALVICSSSTVSPAVEQERDPATLSLKSGNYPEAERFYRHQLESHRSAELLTNMGITLNFEGRFNEAIGYFREALRMRPTIETYGLLAQDLCRTGDLVSADPILDRIIHEKTQDTKILAMVAPCYLDAERPSDAAMVFETLQKASEYPPDLVLMQLVRAYSAVTAQFGKRLRADTGAQVYLKALEDARTGTKSDARGAFEAAARNSPHFVADASFSEAYSSWQLHPEDAALTYQLVVLAGESLIHNFQLCSEKFPESVYLRQFQAEMLADQGQETAAIKILEEIQQSHPSLADPRFRLGMLYRGHGDWEKAAEMFHKAVLSDPNDEGSAARLSESLIQLGRFTDIKEVDEPWLRGKQPALWTFLDLALAEQKLGNIPGSIKVLTSAEKTYPGNRTVHFRLMRLYAQIGSASDSARERVLFDNAATDKP